jgi:tripartite-type tricarboxylate transporter receptor subunit TctC
MRAFAVSGIAFACAAGFAAAVLSVMAEAADFPARPVRLIVPAAPGTGSDFFGRTIAQGLTESLRQQVVADNRAGAGGLIGAELMAGAQPDGYTIGMASTSLLVSPMLQREPRYRPVEDFTPIALLSTITSIVLVTPSLPAKTLQEFVTYAKARPGELNFASVGTGTAAHFCGEIFNQAAGIKAVHVPFRGVADVYNEMFAGRVHYVVFVAPAAAGMYREGRLRGLAVTSARRVPALPDLPSVAEAGLPGATCDTLFGIVGPAKLPKPVVAKLHAEIVSVLRRPETRSRFVTQAAEPEIDTTPESFGQRLRAEHDRYRKLVRDIGIQPQ